MVLLVFILFGLVYLIDEYYMRSVSIITKDWESKVLRTGALAFTSIVPELTLNLIAVFSHDDEMIGFGFGSILGAGIYNLTLCFGLASIASFKEAERAEKF